MDIIFAAVLLLFVAISVVWSVFVRKLVKTRIRSIFVIACVVLALVGTIVIKNLVLDPTFVNGTLLPIVEPRLPAEIADLVNASSTLCEVVLGLPVALISPLVFVVLYTVLSILMGIVYLFVLIFAGRKLKKSDKNNVPYAKAQSIAWSACSAVLALVVILLPLAFYGGLADDALAAVAETDVMDAETKTMVEDINKEYVAPITKGVAVEIFRVFGGDAIVNELTSFPLGDETVYVRDEFAAIAGLVGDIMPLTKAGAPTNYGEAEADTLVAIVNSLTGSKFLTAVGSEAIYFLTDDMVSGEKPMVMADNELFGGLITKAITVIHDDAKDTKYFAEDLKTFAEMASALIKGGVLSNMGDTDALMEELSGGDTIKNVIVALGENKRMKSLIPEVTNIGIEAIASFVDVKDDANDAYNDLLNTIADDLNSVKNMDDAEAQISELSQKLISAFDHAGIVIDKKNIDLYSTAMIEEIVNEKGDADVTAEDVQNFFATNTSVDTTSVQSIEAFEKATLLVFLEDLVVDPDRAAYLITDENVEQEAEAIGGIFSQAGTLLNDVSGEINIGDMAESVGGILNSLSQSVCVGQERTSKLFIAIVQSGIVRDAANMDIATATELGTKGSTGENVDYAKTFKTISNVMDVLQNMNSSTEEGMTEGDLAVVLKDLNPQTAGMIESYITEDRLSQDYGLNEEQASATAPLISDVFGYMGSADMTEEECEKEAEAINDVMNLFTSASDKANSGETSKSVFGGEDSVMGKDAAGTINTIMSSESVKHSLNNNSETLTGDTFGMQNKTNEEGEVVEQGMLSKEEEGQLEEALLGYYKPTEYTDEKARQDDKEALVNIGKLFGFDSDYLNTKLTEKETQNP